MEGRKEWRGNTRSAEHSRILRRFSSQLFDSYIHRYQASVCYTSRECGLCLFFAHQELSDKAVDTVGTNDSVCSGRGTICKLQKDRLIRTRLVFNGHETFAHVYTICRNSLDKIVDEVCSVARLQSCGAFLSVDQLPRGWTMALHNGLVRKFDSIRDRFEVLRGRIQHTEKKFKKVF